MPPTKSLAAQIDESIDSDIYFQEHERDAEPEQMELIEEEDA